jgi:hypothetical protein
MESFTKMVSSQGSDRSGTKPKKQSSFSPLFARNHLQYGTKTGDPGQILPYFVVWKHSQNDTTYIFFTFRWGIPPTKYPCLWAPMMFVSQFVHQKLEKMFAKYVPTFTLWRHKTRPFGSGTVFGGRTPGKFLISYIAAGEFWRILAC